MCSTSLHTGKSQMIRLRFYTEQTGGKKVTKNKEGVQDFRDYNISITSANKLKNTKSFS